MSVGGQQANPQAMITALLRSPAGRSPLVGPDCTVAIFGATSAVAAEVARAYAKRGARLALIGRTKDKLQALADELSAQVVFTRVQDFMETREAEPCVAELSAQLGRIDLALIAHGLLGDQLESERSFAEAEHISQVNYLSVVALLIPLANLLERQAGGRLAVISSVAAERGRPRNYTYAAAKGALNVYLQGLRSRLYASGVTVHTIKLGPVATPMTVDHHKNRLFSDVRSVARHVLRALDRRVDEAFVPPLWGVVMPVVRHLPEVLFQRIGALSGR